IYASATPTDGASISLLEAMRCALPVVVVDNAGNREWVTNGVNGVLFPARDVAALAARLVELADDRQRGAAMGLEAQRVMLDRADWNVNVQRLFALYDRLAGA